MAGCLPTAHVFMPTARWLTPSFLRRLEALELSVQWVRAGQRLGGRFPINRRGASIEFADYSVYSPGDDIRAIDWPLYGRLERLFVKTYKEEVALSVELLVDATASMGAPVPEKFERATQVALSLGYIGLIGRHHVRMSWIRPVETGRTTPLAGLAASRWLHHRSDIVRLAEQAERMRPGGGVELADWLRRAVIGLKIRGGQAILITDGMLRPADFFRALNALIVRNLEVKVIQIVTPQELHPGRRFGTGAVVDIESGAVQQLAYSPAQLEQAMAEHNELLARFCKRRGVPFVQYRMEESLESFVTKTLPTRGFLE